MKQLSLIVFFSLFYSLTAVASGEFEPTSKACVDVSKEINRVNDDLQVAKSGIQKSWLHRQLRALKAKRGSCSLKGFHNKPHMPFSDTNSVTNEASIKKGGHTF